MPFAVLLAFVLIAGVRPLSAQSFESVGTRAQGMGGAFVAVADDASAVYWNPAGLGTGATLDGQLEIGRQGSVFAGLAIPSLGVSYWRLPTVSVSGGRQEEGSGVVRPSVLRASSFGITVLQTLVNGVVVGTTMRLVRGEVGATGTNTSFDLDAGVLASIGPARVGLTARNLRSPEFPLGDGAQSVSLERQVRLGVALAPRSRPTGVHGPFTVGVDLDITTSRLWLSGRRELVEGRRNLAMGGEYWWAAGRVGARAGLRFSTRGDRAPSGSAGVSLGLSRSTFIDGQMTKGRRDSDGNWGITGRVTF